MSAGAFIVEDAFPNLILTKVKERVRIERIEFAVDDYVEFVAQDVSG